MSEPVNNLFCIPWDVPASEPPTNPVVMNVSAVVGREVLKKLSAVRIPANISKSQPIVVNPPSLEDYHTFSVFIKTSCRTLEQNQNVIYFADLEDEHRFIFSINCLWAIISGRTEITLLAVSLNNDLSSRLVHWDKVSEEVINDMTPLHLQLQKNRALLQCKQ